MTVFLVGLLRQYISLHFVQLTLSIIYLCDSFPNKMARNVNEYGVPEIPHTGQRSEFAA